MSTEYHKQYYENHKEIWNKKVKCEICNGEYNNASKYRHLKSKIHLLAEKQKKINDLEQQVKIMKTQLERFNAINT